MFPFTKITLGRCCFDGYLQHDLKPSKTLVGNSVLVGVDSICDFYYRLTFANTLPLLQSNPVVVRVSRSDWNDVFVSVTITLLHSEVNSTSAQHTRSFNFSRSSSNLSSFKMFLSSICNDFKWIEPSISSLLLWRNECF